MNNRDYIKSITDIGLILQALIKNRFRKTVKIIYTKGKYKSLYVSFYRSPYVYQFYVEDHAGYYLMYLIKNDKIVKKELIRKEELVNTFYQKLGYFFRIIN